MKKILLVGVLLLVISVHPRVAEIQAGEQPAGVIWGVVLYGMQWGYNMGDYAYVLEEDYNPTSYRDGISGARPHQYWIVNDLRSARYRMAIYVQDCDKHSISGRFYYIKGSIRQKNMLACSNSQMDQ